MSPWSYCILCHREREKVYRKRVRIKRSSHANFLAKRIIVIGLYVVEIPKKYAVISIRMSEQCRLKRFLIPHCTTLLMTKSDVGQGLRPIAGDIVKRCTWYSLSLLGAAAFCATNAARFRRKKGMNKNFAIFMMWLLILNKNDNLITCFENRSSNLSGYWGFLTHVIKVWFKVVLNG